MTEQENTQRQQNRKPDRQKPASKGPLSRADALAEKMRENLRRRKQQSRARSKPIA